MRVARPHVSELCQLFITYGLWVVDDKELNDLTTRWGGEPALVEVHFLDTQFLHQSVNRYIGGVSHSVIMEPTHFQRLDKSVVLVAPRLSIEKDGYHRVWVRFIIFLTIVHHVQL